MCLTVVGHDFGKCVLTCLCSDGFVFVFRWLIVMSLMVFDTVLWRLCSKVSSSARLGSLTLRLGHCSTGLQSSTWLA